MVSTEVLRQPMPCKLEHVTARHWNLVVRRVQAGNRLATKLIQVGFVTDRGKIASAPPAFTLFFVLFTDHYNWTIKLQQG